MTGNKREVNGEKEPSAKIVKLDFGPIPPGQSNFSEDNSIAPDFINNLNDDCLSHIFKYLPLDDRFTLQAVCQRWRENCHVVWGDVKSLDLTQIVPSNSVAKRTDSSIMKMFKGCGICLRQLKIGHHHDKSTLLPFVSEYCSQLRKLEIEFIYNDKLCPKQTRNKRVERKCNTKTRDVLVNFFMALPHETLTELHLSVYPPSRLLTSFIPRAAMTVFDKLTNLSSLTLNNYILTSDPFESINEHLNLKFLSFSRYWIAQVLFNRIPLEYLEQLNLSSIQTVTSDVIVRVSEECKNLKHLDLSNCYEVNDRGISALVNLPQLESLIVSYISQITDEPFSRMHNLRRLDCRQCPCVLGNGITTLLESAQNLEYLDIKLSGVTFDFLRATNAILRQRTSGITLKIFVCSYLGYQWDQESRDCPDSLVIHGRLQYN